MQKILRTRSAAPSFNAPLFNFPSIAAAFALALSIVAAGCAEAPGGHAPGLSAVHNIVVIYAENRSFDNLYGPFPEANGLQNATPASTRQLDRNGEPLPMLPPVWNGLTQRGVIPDITQAMTAGLPNAPFAIDDPQRYNAPIHVPTRDLWHRFYENQMQI
ncbi:MAG: hypothetical protein QOH33_239, partial [Paraburkholderia sp.]|nr:hypothetical protein [Paraburkholderia sp.]